jgi:tetratricopeptide (TPR) repeat protein
MQHYNHLMRLIEYKIFVALFLFLLSFSVFTPSLKNGFVWDDVETIERSYFSFKASRIASIVFTENKGKQKVASYYYRPIFFISMVVDKDMWGVSPFGFHLSNLIFHSVSTVLFYFLALLVFGEFRVDGKEAIAFLSSLFFALHPMHVESVSWIAGRTDVLCSLFFFLAFIFHMLSYKKLRFFPLSVVCFFLSLLSKEVAVVFLIVTLGFDLLSGKITSRSNTLKYAIYAVLVLLYFYLRGRTFMSVPEISGENVQRSTHKVLQILEILKVLLSSYLFYINKLVFPFDFNAFITTVPGDFYYLVSSILVILVLCVIGFVSIRKREFITAFSIFWIFATLGPSCLVAIFVVSSTPLAERYLYIPSAGYCLLIAYLILKVEKRIKAQRIGWAFVSVLCLSYLFFTIERQGVWKDNLALWGDTLKKSPNCAIPHSNYGMALRDVGRTDEAIRELLIALDSGIKDTKRGRAITANNLGYVLYLDKGDYKNAERWFLKALYYDPMYGRAYYHLGLIYFIKGKNENSIYDYQTAERYLKKTLEIDTSYGRANLLLAKVYMGLGKREKAREQARMALQNGLIEPLSKEARDILNELGK